MKNIALLLGFLMIVGFTCSRKVIEPITSNEKPVQAEEPAMVDTPVEEETLDEPIHFENETHLKNVRQLTFGGENAEAYFSFDGTKLVLQRTNKEEGIMCDQIYWGNIPKTDSDRFELSLVSTGKGRTTCSYFLPGDDRIIYASTHAADENCPPVPDREKIKKYVWPIYPSFEIYTSKPDGSDLKRLTDNQFYDAEPTVSPDGKKIVYTSNKSGDLELYVMDIDGSNEIQVTSGLGYDGGAFFSPDSKMLVWRASRPQTEEAIKEYKDLLAQDMVAPTNMELYVSNIDGSNARQVTNLGQANWAPFFHPSGKKLIFASNHESKFGFPFNMYLINLDGTGLERVTHDETFDAFPMFSPDGTKLVFSSNRNNGDTRDTNVFIADWVE